MTFRVLASSEWGLVEPDYRERNVALPDPAHSFIVGAFEDSGELAGFMVCQAQIHAEPLLLKNPYAYRGILRCLEAELSRQFPSGCAYFVTTPPGAVSSGMAEVMGITRCDLELRRKVLASRVPDCAPALAFAGPSEVSS